MRLNNRPPGSSTTFIDSASGEHVLQIASDEDGVLLVAYHLYDDSGALVAQSAGLEEPSFGLAIQSESGDALLTIPADLGGDLQYRLYGRNGGLLTHSDGVRTKIYPRLRMEGVGRAWRRPGS
jgi:hypothetical protein